VSDWTRKASALVEDVSVVAETDKENRRGENDEEKKKKEKKNFFSKNKGNKFFFFEFFLKIFSQLSSATHAVHEGDSWVFLDFIPLFFSLLHAHGQCGALTSPTPSLPLKPPKPHAREPPHPPLEDQRKTWGGSSSGLMMDFLPFMAFLPFLALLTFLMKDFGTEVFWIMSSSTSSGRNFL